MNDRPPLDPGIADMLAAAGLEDLKMPVPPEHTTLASLVAALEADEREAAITNSNEKND